MAKEVLDTIMNIQPKDSSGGSGETRESFVYRIASDMLEKLPPDYIPHEVRKQADSGVCYACEVCVHTYIHTYIHTYNIHIHTHT